MPPDPFYRTEVDPYELQIVLLDHFLSATATDTGYRFQSQNSSHYVDLHFSKKGKLSKIVASPRFPKSQLQQIEKTVSSLLPSAARSSVGNVIGFAQGQVDGSFSYRDLFQVIPVPAGAPQPNARAAADHPFVLQVAFNQTGQLEIDAMRIHQAATTYGRILGLLLLGKIRLAPVRNRTAWALHVIDPFNAVSEWSQLEYRAGVPQFVSEFAGIAGLRGMEVSTFQKFYSEPFVQYQSLHIPNNLADSLDVALSLNPEDFDRFTLACGWYASERRLATESYSAGYVALVTAIESLSKEEKAIRCSECGQPRHELGKRFRDFINRYAPFTRNFERELSRLYAVRSQLTHGLDLLELDRAPWRNFMNIRAEEEQRLGSLLRFIVGVAIFNWLWTRNRPGVVDDVD